MSRLICLPNDAPELSVQQELRRELRSTDEAFLLPNASRSKESGAFKNVICKLDAADPVSASLFSGHIADGVSLLEIPAAAAERVCGSAAARARSLRALKDAIPSEVADPSLTVGPALEGDADDRDKSSWTPGFDSRHAMVGLYSARVRKPGIGALAGTQRVHVRFFLACRAGAGLAGATFSARLAAALTGGASLGSALAEHGEPGAAALRRAQAAGARNRRRILLLAAEALDVHEVDAVPDPASFPEEPCRFVVPSLNADAGTIRRSTDGKSFVCAFGCVESGSNSAFAALSNLADGLLVWTAADGTFRVKVRNEVMDALPFSSRRLVSSLDAAKRASEALRSGGHPDSEFLGERFAWRNKELDARAAQVEPPALWGSHEALDISAHARDLGVESVSLLKLEPETVCVAGVEPSKLRAVLRKP